MSTRRPRWKLFVRVAGVMFVVIVALVAAPLPWPKPVVVIEAVPVVEVAPVVKAVPTLSIPDIDWTDGGIWMPDPMLLLGELERGRWRAGDSVEDVLACYKQHETFVASPLGGFTVIRPPSSKSGSALIFVQRYGEFTTISELRCASYGPIRAEYEIIAFRGRLKAAGVKPQPARAWDGADPYSHVYFDTMTEEERLEYIANRAWERNFRLLSFGVVTPEALSLCYKDFFDRAMESHRLRRVMSSPRFRV